jgi:hypothetical protein
MKHDLNLLEQAHQLLMPRKKSVIGPLGEQLTFDLLPQANSRWTPRRKAEVVAAVHGGMLDVGEACEMYNISLEEFDSWDRAIERTGLRGLRVTQFQNYRKLLARD